eukprot:2459868-Amphidinium_carterae.1
MLRLELLLLLPFRLTRRASWAFKSSSFSLAGLAVALQKTVLMGCHNVPLLLVKFAIDFFMGLHSVNSRGGFCFALMVSASSWDSVLGLLKSSQL